MKIRFAKIFNGTKRNPSYKLELQYYSDDLSMWVKVPEEWATIEDEILYNKAKKLEEHLQYR